MPSSFPDPIALCVFLDCALRVLVNEI